MSILRYAELRLEGHPKLEFLVSPIFNLVRSRLEREPPTVMADLGKGQRASGLWPIRYDLNGRPVPTRTADPPQRPRAAEIVVSSVDALRQALERAQPGTSIELTPGEYRLTASLHAAVAGTAQLPILVRAQRPGTVTLVVDTVQAIVVSQPYWVFENLSFRGACANHTQCEHAFHVVGHARGVSIINNHMSDFNAQIKINGEGGQWPDDGIVQFNTLENSRGRRTDNPVTPIDLVAANGWQFLDNRVANFAKPAARNPSYGMFMKGGGQGGRIERNLIICTPQAVSQPGLRVGISVGGGGTDPGSCRDGRCSSEFSGAVVANNVVAHCNDAGIDISKATDSVVIHNTLVNTQGILVRNPPSDAEIRNNLLEGAIRVRASTHASSAGNLMASRLSSLLSDPDALDLRWKEPPALVGRDAQAAGDFCGLPRQAVSPAGATVAASC